MVISILHLKENHQKDSTLILKLQRIAAFVECAGQCQSTAALLHG